MLEIIADKWQTVLITVLFSGGSTVIILRTESLHFLDKQNRQAKERSSGGPGVMLDLSI